MLNVLVDENQSNTVKFGVFLNHFPSVGIADDLKFFTVTGHLET